ncbi:MAG: glycosyltransferase family protein [Polyangiaceae bacterium]
MKVVVVVQARLASSRLPAKILLDLGGTTALERCLRRARKFAHVDEVVVATSDLPGDDVVAAVARRLGSRVVRGSETDVLSRFAKAAEECDADAVVRCTSDCPLLDPTLSSKVVEAFVKTPGAVDYAANVLERRLPRGLDTEILSREALLRAHRDATDPGEREHVTQHVVRRPESFRCVSVTEDSLADHSSMRWTLDTLDDYRLLATLFDRLGPAADDASMSDVLALFRSDSSLAVLNAHVAQKTT